MSFATLAGGGPSFIVPAFTLPSTGVSDIHTNRRAVPCTTEHVKGAWVEAIADTGPLPWAGFALNLGWQERDSAAQRHLLDVGIGPAGSEQVIVPDLSFVRRAYQSNDKTLWLPLAIPPHSRLAFRQQADRTATFMGMTVSLYGVPQMPGIPVGYRRMAALNVNAAATDVAVTVPGGRADSMGQAGSSNAAVAIGTAPWPVRAAMLVPVNTVNYVTWATALCVGATGEQLIAPPTFAHGNADSTNWSNATRAHSPVFPCAADAGATLYLRVWAYFTVWPLAEPPRVFVYLFG